MFHDILIAVSASLALACFHAAVLVWRWRSGAPTSEAMSFVLLSDALWAGAYAAELVSPGMWAKLFWDAAQALPAIATPFATLGLVWRHRGGDRGFSRGWLGGGIGVGAVFALALTLDSQHSWTRFDPRLEPNAWALLGYDPSWTERVVHSAALGCALASIVVLLHGALGDVGRRRRQWAEVLCFLSPPVAVALLEECGLGLAPQIHTTPLWFGAAHLLWAWTLFPRRMLDLGSLARRVVVEQSPDAILALDSWGRIAEANPAAERVLGRGAAVGRELASVLPELPGAASQCGGRPFEVRRGARIFEGRALPLCNRGGELRGRAISLRDVTASAGARRLGVRPEVSRPPEVQAAVDLCAGRVRALVARSVPALFIDRDNRRLEFDAAACRTRGLEQENLPGAVLLDAAADGDERTSTERIQQASPATAGGERVRLELEIAQESLGQGVELTLRSADGGGDGAAVLLVQARALGEKGGGTRRRSHLAVAR